MFQTKVEIPTSELKISHKDQILTLGSCFAENIGKKMKQVYFNVDINPFGVLYNPISIQKSIDLLVDNKVFAENDLFQHHDLWQSFSFSSLFSAVSFEQCLSSINNSLNKASLALQSTNFLMITFGTAWVFEDRETGSVVSNCHKLPANRFNRRCLTVSEIVTVYSDLIHRIHTLFPNLKLIFSVSPIRHSKDGAHANNISKSVLLLAVDALQNKFDQLCYFPAYEIQMDELRDYRFYASDMIHPSDVAVEYIWRRFAETYFDDTTMKIKKEMEQLNADMSHKPLFPESEEYILFQRNVKNRKERILTKYPFLADRIK